MSEARQRFGRRGERRAARHLRRHGLGIIDRNWSCSAGELDILAREGDQLVVVEVRSARGDFAGGPELTVGPDKQRRLARLAQLWLRGSRWQPPDGVRFDVIGAVYRGWLRWELRWYKNAFTV